jgi:hypothetical protein
VRFPVKVVVVVVVVKVKGCCQRSPIVLPRGGLVIAQVMRDDRQRE